MSSRRAVSKHDASCISQIHVSVGERAFIDSFITSFAIYDSFFLSPQTSETLNTSFRQIFSSVVFSLFFLLTDSMESEPSGVCAIFGVVVLSVAEAGSWAQRDSEKSEPKCFCHISYKTHPF